MMASPLAMAVWQWWAGRDGDVDWLQVRANAGALLMLIAFWIKIKKMNRETVHELKRKVAARETPNASD